ncbi:MAG: LacI family DNA-binding transcriptional regulator [Clostridia bacterium]|nr:LacI family DNA-binding transcriptional regulator [Clostridia bacterium]
MSSSVPKLKTIAENLGLSIGTVQRALHDKGGYSQETKEMVLKEAERIGYTANTAASALRRSPISIGILLPEPVGKNSYFFSYVWQGIEKAVSDLSIYQINLVRTFAEPGSEEYVAALESFLNSTDSAIQGLITVTRHDKRVDQLISALSEKGIPIFIINSSYENAPANCYSISANRHIGHLGADLFSAIHRHTRGTLLLLGGDRKNRLQVERSLDFCQRIGADCPELNLLEVHYYHDLPKLKAFVSDCLSRFEDIIGLFAVSARETLTACQAVSDSGNRDITLIGTDAFPELLPFFESGILTASIYQYPAKQSYIAVHMLVSAITKAPQQQSGDNFPIVPVFKSTAAIFCGPNGLI